MDELKNKSQLPPEEVIPPLTDAMTDPADSAENSRLEIATVEPAEKQDVPLPEEVEPIITDEENADNAQVENTVNAALDEEENKMEAIEQLETIIEETKDTSVMQPEEGTLIISAGESYEIDVSDKNCVLEYLGDNATIEVFNLWYDTVLKNYEGSAQISINNSAATGEKQTWSASGFANDRLIKKHITVTSGKIKVWNINQPNISIKKLDHSALSHWYLSAGDSIILSVANPYGYKGIEYYLHCNTADKYTAHEVVYSKTGEVKYDHISDGKFYRPMRQGETIEITMEEGSAHFYAGYHCLVEN